MKKKILPILMGALLISASPAFCDESVLFKARWPYGPKKAVAADDKDNPAFIFLGKGDFINILDINLNMQASYQVPTSPEEGGDVSGIFYSAPFLYVAFGIGGLKIIDVSHPTAPELKGEYYDPQASGIARDIYVDGDFAYIIEVYLFREPQITKFDISDPANPQFNGACLLPFITNPSEVVVSGNYAFVADAYLGLHVIDVSGEILDNDDYIGNGIVAAGAIGVDIVDDYAYVTRGSYGMDIIYIAGFPPDAENTEFSIPTENSVASGIDVYQGNAYIADWNGALHVIDVNGKARPDLIASYVSDISGAYSVCVAGDNAYLMDHGTGLLQIDVSDPSTLVCNGTYSPPADAKAVYATQGADSVYVYSVDNVAGTDPSKEGLRIIEVLDFDPIPLLLPELKGFCPTPGQAQDVFVLDSYAYVADGMSGLQIIDISDKAAPSISKTVALTDATGVYVFEDIAYVADGASGLRLINVSTPTSPGSPVTRDTPGQAKDVFVFNGYAYVADGTKGLQVIDISQPTNPNIIASVDTTDAQDVFFADNYAFIADGSGGLRIIDVSNPAQPSQIGAFATAGKATGIRVSGGVAFLVDDTGEFMVIDISDPSNPSEKRSWESPGHSAGVFVLGKYAYVADGAGGVAVLEHSYDPDDGEDTPPPTPLVSSSGCFISAL